MKMKVRVFHCCLLLLLLCSTDGTHCYRPTPSDLYAKFKENADATQHTTTGQVPAKVFYPSSYGGDPTGEKDSSDAFRKAIEDAFNVTAPSDLLPGVKDLGGVQVDLQGGEYMISKPLRFPANAGGNIIIKGGTIRASADFPTDGYLIEQSSALSAANTNLPTAHAGGGDGALTDTKLAGVGIDYEDVTYRDLLLDASYRGGGLMVVKSARTRIQNCFVIHFMTDGILVDGGHETFISNSFLGQHLTVGGDPGERNFSGTAINLKSNDNALTDIAIFSAATGVLLGGQANVLTGVHCYNKATYWGGIGVLVKLGGLAQTRLDNCYMDYTGIVVEDPVQFHVSNSFFLGDANVKLVSVAGTISGLNIVDNMFSGSNNGVQIVVLDESSGRPFSKVEQVVVDRNNVNGMWLKSTVARKTASGNSTSWTVDFSPDLIFPARITHVGYSLTVKGSAEIPAHAIEEVVNNTVTVRTNNPVNGVVSVFVDQFALPGEMMGQTNKERLAEFLGELQRKENTNDRYVAALRGETLTRKPYQRIQPVPREDAKTAEPEN